MTYVSLQCYSKWLRYAVSASSESLLEIAFLGWHLTSSGKNYRICVWSNSPGSYCVYKFEKNTASLYYLNVALKGKSKNWCFHYNFLVTNAFYQVCIFFKNEKC
jgi:hypothetical protein